MASIQITILFRSSDSLSLSFSLPIYTIDYSLTTDPLEVGDEGGVEDRGEEEDDLDRRGIRNDENEEK